MSLWICTYGSPEQSSIFLDLTGVSQGKADVTFDGLDSQTAGYR